MKGEHKQPDFLALNPFGQVPVLVDGNTVVSDSQAILTYLALKYNPQWFPTAPEMAAQVVRWLSVAANEISQGLAAARLFYLLDFKNVNIPHSARQIVIYHVLRKKSFCATNVVRSEEGI